MLKVYAVFDVKGAAFSGLMLFTTRGIALREFANVCLNPEAPMHKYPGDYALYELAEYDPNSGLITSLPQPLHVASAAACLSSVNSYVSAPELVAEVKS